MNDYGNGPACTHTGGTATVEFAMVLSKDPFRVVAVDVEVCLDCGAMRFDRFDTLRED